mmetsp:Transcript_46149/g.73338  ORF Transcript_46149/g.73338 Transcript_46149/m.73338 type:complete len:436 (-) Transcript_46149:82-1389(-)
MFDLGMSEPSATSKLGFVALANGQIQQNLLASTRDGIGAHVPVEPLCLLSQAGSSVGVASKDLARLTGAVLKDLGRMSLHQRDGAAEGGHGLVLGHLAELKGQVLQPVVDSLDLPSHLRELPADHWMLNEFLPKSGSLVRKFPRIFDQASTESACLHHEPPALVVEILHDNTKALILLANEVFRRHLNRIKFHIGGATWPNTLAVHPLRCDPGALLQKKHGDSTHAWATSAHGTSKVVGEDAICDPFLVPINNVKVTILLSHGLDGSHITSSIGLCDVQGDDLFPHEAVRGHAFLHLLRAEVQHRRKTDLQPLDEAPQDSAASAPGELIHKDQFMEVIQILRGIVGYQVKGTRVGAHHDGQKPSLSTLDVSLLGHCLVHLPLADEGNDVFVHKSSASLTPGLMGLLVIGAVVGTVVPIGVAIGVAKAEGLWGAHG